MADTKTNPPNLQLIERARTSNFNYSDDDLDVSLITKIEDSSNTFNISLDAERKKDKSKIRLETRIALEQHRAGEKHHQPHIQIDNICSDDELLKKGILHITLLVNDQEELDNCCNGFIFIISEILNEIESFFEVNKKLVDFFFFPQALSNLGQYKENLHALIYKSFKENKKRYDEKGEYLVEFKGKKSESIDITNYFKLLGLLLRMKLLDPLLITPLLNLITEDGNIRSNCYVDITRWKKELLEMNKDELQYLNRSTFIKKFAK